MDKIKVIFLTFVISIHAYDYLKNGDDWYQQYPACAKNSQSPINLEQKTATTDQNLITRGYGFVDYPASALHLTQEPSSSLTLEFDGSGEFNLQDQNNNKCLYQISEANFHSPSEHQIERQSFFLELQIQHQLRSFSGNCSQTLIIAIMFDPNNIENEFIKQLSVNQLNGISKDNTVPNEIGFSKFLKQLDFSKYFSYNGSFTEPPCSEDVYWIVLKQVQSMSNEQKMQFQVLWSQKQISTGNNRKTQQLHGRQIKYNSAISLILSLTTALLLLIII